MGVTLALLLFWEHLEYIYKREFALSNAALLMLDAAAMVLLAAAVRLMRRKGMPSPGPRYAKAARIMMAAVLFGAQIALCLNNL